IEEGRRVDLRNPRPGRGTQPQDEVVPERTPRAGQALIDQPRRILDLRQQQPKTGTGFITQFVEVHFAPPSVCSRIRVASLPQRRRGGIGSVILLYGESNPPPSILHTVVCQGVEPFIIRRPKTVFDPFRPVAPFCIPGQVTEWSSLPPA